MNASTALHRIAKASDRLEVVQSAELQALIRCVASQLVRSPETAALTLASVCWACAKLSYLDLPLFDFMAARAVARVADMGFQECSNIAWAFAMLELFHGPLLENLRGLAVAKMPSFDAQGISNLVWALAKLLVLDEPLMFLSAGYFADQLAESTPQNRSNFCWAYALLMVQPPCLSTLARVCESIHELEMQDITNTAWALAVQTCLGVLCMNNALSALQDCCN